MRSTKFAISISAWARECLDNNAVFRVISPYRLNLSEPQWRSKMYLEIFIFGVMRMILACWITYRISYNVCDEIYIRAAIAMLHQNVRPINSTNSWYSVRFSDNLFWRKKKTKFYKVSRCCGAHKNIIKRRLKKKQDIYMHWTLNKSRHHKAPHGMLAHHSRILWLNILYNLNFIGLWSTV